MSRPTLIFPEAGPGNHSGAALLRERQAASDHSKPLAWRLPLGSGCDMHLCTSILSSVTMPKPKEDRERMECPHCRAELTAKPHVFALGIDQDGTWQVSNTRCPVCERLVVNLCTKEGCTYPAWPVASTRARLSEDVPPQYAADYHTAAQIIFFSEEASAALSRRSLHRFLAEKVHAGHGGLADQIRQAGLAPDLPAYLKQALSKLAALAELEPESPKSQHPEGISTVQPGEAEWLLDVLQSLYDLYFVEPARMQRKQDALEESTAPQPQPGPTETPGNTGAAVGAQAQTAETVAAAPTVGQVASAETVATDEPNRQ
jgi:hypothetical protein